ncbi:polyadenylate-binding protein (nucleomorph) [Chroomonas mesostigmatica CCMP1168]|uniref:Polyadenylate-binding protein n=1 Tax=Chroomonas mesostigmatica CCMP1168 TaxID=1195612 RepID=J7G3P5_9CRYP|nr:polyadenylate-binding protein [Chroomonas mesostigmatica CCMP1168]
MKKILKSNEGPKLKLIGDSSNKKFLKRKIKIKNPCSLYVGDLSIYVEESSLMKIFSKIGKVHSIQICRDFSTGISRGYSYVNFLNPKDAQKAFKLLNYYTDETLHYKPLRIMWVQKDKSLRFSGTGNLFIKNIPRRYDNKSLSKLFSQFGKILSCKIALDENKRSMGYGFVHYKEEKDSKKAIEKMNNCFIDGEKIFVGPFISKVKRNNRNNSKLRFTNVYIKNILFQNCNEIYIKDLFEIFGPITSIFIPKANEAPLGFAFVNFENPEDAEDAIFKMNGKKIKGKTLYVGKAETRIERQRRLAKKFLDKKMSKVCFYKKLMFFISDVPIFIKSKILTSAYLKIGLFRKFKILSKKKKLSIKLVVFCFDRKKFFKQLIKNYNFLKKFNLIVAKFPQSLSLIDYKVIQLNKSKKHRGLRKKEEKLMFKVLFSFPYLKINFFLIFLLIRSFYRINKDLFRKLSTKIFSSRKDDFISFFFCGKSFSKNKHSLI